MMLYSQKLEGVQGHIDQYNQEVQKVVSLRDEITLLQKGLQAEKNKVLVLQKQLLESNARASSLDESLNIQLREVLKTRNALDKMEKMYKNLCGVGLADLDEKVLHELEATHLEALKLTQKELLRRQMQTEKKSIEDLERAKRELEEKQTCKVCRERQTEVLLLPCRHQCLCGECAGQLQSCPVCRSQISDKIHIFIS
eukprot:TRINITY_DN6556_c0_g2_i1.p1 TRINITY_DN6556_c0_g2~~TRINITY_DN6556_c0_g2_i1.p1  ORF type:complete len:198 (+),score=39.07 TRINITY_DN6556_c0_g2_i1:456-1049(+)